MLTNFKSWHFWFLVRRVAVRVFWICLAITWVTSGIGEMLPPSGWQTLLLWVPNIAFTGATLGAATWIVARGVSWWKKGPLRWGLFTPRVRKEYLAKTFDEALATARLHRLYLVRVVRVYQVSRAGSKCIVEHPDGTRQDAWFWRIKPKTRAVVLVRGSSGYGPHNSNLHVMYVGDPMVGNGIVGGIPSPAWGVGRKSVKRW